jgi:hypothetical protein
MKKLALTSVLGAALLFLSCKSEIKQVDTSLERASALMETTSAEFKSAWDSGNVEALAATFTEDGIRVISGSQEAIVGSAAIYESFGLAHAEGSRFMGSHIELTVVDTQFISDDIMIGSGSFHILNAANESLEQGNWGNVYKVIDNKARLLMESAFGKKVNVEASNEELTQVKLS